MVIKMFVEGMKLTPEIKPVVDSSFRCLGVCSYFETSKN